MSRKYVLHLTSSERAWLTRIAKGRCGRRHPAGWKMERARALLKCDEGPEGEGWTDEVIAAALDVSARSVGRWCRQAVEAGPEAVLERRAHAPRPCKRAGEGEAQLLQWAQSTPPDGRARWTLRLLAQALEARAVVAEISYETVRRTLKKRPDALAPGATRLPARARVGLRGPDGSGAGSLLPAARCAPSRGLHGRTAQTAAVRNADAAARATGTARHLRLRIRAARLLHPLAVRGAAGPVAHGQRHRPTHGRGLGALGQGAGGPPALPSG